MEWKEGNLIKQQLGSKSIFWFNLIHFKCNNAILFVLTYSSLFYYVPMISIIMAYSVIFQFINVSTI